MSNTQLALREDSSIFASPERFEIAGKMAVSLSRSTIVPKEYQNNPSNGLIAIELANRLGVSPLMVMQNLYVVYGRPSWSAQYMIAMINSSGIFDFELQYKEEVDKAGKPYSCQCWTERNGRKVTGPVITMDMARAEGWLNKTGSKWQTMPQMMLRYRAASFFGRMNCPELTMGIYTREEVVELGPDEYTEVTYKNVANTEAQVKQDIAENANTVDFEEELPINEPTPEAVKAAEEMPDTQKRGRKKTVQAEVEEEPKEEPIEVPVEPVEVAPDWA